MWAGNLKCFGLLADRDQAGLSRLGRGRNTSRPQLETEGFVYATSIRVRYRFGGPAERAWLWARALGKNFTGEAPWAILAFYFVRLPKSVQILNNESSEFGPAVAICPVYIEARFGQIAEPVSLVWVSQVRYQLAHTQAETWVFWCALEPMAAVPASR